MLVDRTHVDRAITHQLILFTRSLRGGPVFPVLSTRKGVVTVRSYRSVLNAYVNNAESKFDGPDGKQCCSWTRGILQRTHVVAGEHRYCGNEFKRKLEQGPVDHEVEFKCKVYENGRVAAGPQTLRQLAGFSERRILEATGVHRDTIRLLRHGKGVKRAPHTRK